MVHGGEEGCVSNLINDAFLQRKLLTHLDLNHVVTPPNLSGIWQGL